MPGKKLSHPTLWLLLALASPWPAIGLTATAQETADANGDLKLPPPPKTIEDISKLLDHYQPDPSIAAAAKAAADTQPPQTTDRAVLFDFYWQRGQAAEKIGRVHQQIEDMRKAREYGNRTDFLYLRALDNLGVAETAGGNLLNALRYSEELLAITPQNKSGYFVGGNRKLIVQYAMLGDFEAARTKLRELESAFVMLKRSKNWSDNQHNWTMQYEAGRAELFRLEGHFGEAEAAYRRAWQENALYLVDHLRLVAQGLDVPTQETVLRNREGIERNLAGVLLAQGKVVEAEIMARQVLRHSLERVGRASQDVGQDLRVLGLILAEEGRTAESTRLAEVSLEAFTASGATPDSLTLAEARRALGSALVAQKRYREALAVFEAMRAGIGSDEVLLSKVGSNDLDWVLALLRTGAPEPAANMASALLEDSTKKFGPASVRTAETRTFHAMALSARGQYQEAFDAFRKAVPVLIDQARNDAEAESGTFKRQQRLILVLENYLHLLAVLKDKPEVLPPGFDVVAESFQMADIARSSGVQRALTASAARARLDDPALAELARKEQDAQQRINSLSQLLTQLLSARPDQQLPKIQEAIRVDIATLRQQREGYKHEILRRFPEYAQLVDPKPATLTEVRNHLQPGEVLVAWYFGEESGQAWALTRDGQPIFTSLALGRRELAAEVAKLRKALDPNVASIDEIPAFDVTASYHLFQTILQPLRPAWQGARVMLAVPHAELGQLPLSVLLTDAALPPGKTAVPFAGYQKLPWLAKQSAIAQLPSVTALMSLRSLKPARADRRPFIGFGDPIFSREQLAQAQVETGTGVVATRGLPLKRRNTPKTEGLDSAELALLPRLPDTSGEIRQIAHELGAEQDDDIYLQTRASEQAVLNADLASRRVVMFATHGLVPGDLDGLNEPALALSSPEVSGGNGDGLLTLDEILGLRLNADWVVLSACNTAAGDGNGSEAVSGLGRAFFFAGARALLVSNWPVETVSARLLMTELFHRQKADPHLGKAEALRQSMLALIDGPGSVDDKSKRTLYNYAHPLFWAPFVVVGD